MQHLVQLGELIPIKGIFYKVVDASGQSTGFPEAIVLSPYKLTMHQLKRRLREKGTIKPKSRERGKI